MKKILFTLLLIPILNFSQYTAIPDTVFEQHLIYFGYDNVIDGQVLTSNISSATIFSVGGPNLTDLTGIEDFVSLSHLAVLNTQLTSLDLSQNTALTYLLCNGNQLTSLDVSQNIALDSISCLGNQLTSLDLSQNIALNALDCSFNQLTSLDLSQNTALTYLQCGNNQLTSLDVSQNIALTLLSCSNNQLTSLDVSQNTALTLLGCSNNQLNCLNLKNGNNLSMQAIGASGNNNLNCVEVDDPNWSSNNWTSFFDVGVTFSSNCNYPIGCSVVNCNDTVIYDTTNIFVADAQFQIISPHTYLVSSDTFPRPNYPNCDSILTNYRNYIYNPNYYTDTNYVSISVTDTLYIDITVTGVPGVDNTISVYPNPANEVVIIDNGNYSTMSNYSLVIINSLSQQVFSSQINAQQFQIPVSTLGAEGTYFIQIFDGNNNLVTTKYLVLN